MQPFCHSSQTGILYDMRKRIVSSAFFYPLLLFFITVGICILNYTPGTWLTGWDTLHPELDFELNFGRLLQGVWRPEQGLGALAGHSHMADLPRVIMLWFAHFVFAPDMLRYLYIFACFIIGPLGMYVLAQTIIPSAQKHRSIAFLGALFYIFNLSTVQQFYAPFEMFPTQWAALPWTIYAAVSYIKSPSSGWRNKYLGYFFIITLLSTPQAYAAHLWYPFVAVFGLSIALYSVFSKPHPLRSLNQSLAKPLILAAMLICVNGFWLFPNMYFIATASSVPKESRQNRLFSQEYRIRNRENGYLSDVALMRGFYLNWSAYDFEKGRFGTLMPAWSKHLNNPFVSAIGYGAFLLVCYGVVESIRQRNKLLMSHLPYFVVPLMFLLNRTPPFEQLFDTLLHLSLFEEASRFIFTKMSILQLMGYSLFFTFGLWRLQAQKWYTSSLHLIIPLLLVVYAFPQLQGNLIGKQFRIQIPHQYGDFWTFMKEREDGRVLSLPLHTISGWQYYDWGYQGAGFLWFNLKQPLLDRDFDRWNVHNEQAFREFQYAVYSQRPDLFVQNLDKFSIRYVVWDQSVITADPKNRKQMLFERETSALVEKLVANGDLVQAGTFGTIELYTTRRQPPAQRIRALSSNVKPSYRWAWTDAAYSQLGDYITSDDLETPFVYTYPFRNITTASDRVSTAVSIDPSMTTITLPKNRGDTYIVPSISEHESIFYVNVEVQKASDTQLRYTFTPLVPGAPQALFLADADFDRATLTSEINTSSFRTPMDEINTNRAIPLGQAALFTNRDNIINGQITTLTFEASSLNADSGLVLSVPTQQTITPDQIVLQSSDRTAITVKQQEDSVVASFTSQYVQNGSYIPMDELPHAVGYLMGITARNVEGIPIRICLKNYYSDTCDVYDELSKSDTFVTDYFFIPPTDDGQGYGLSLDNISFGKAATINEVRDIRIAAVPFEYLWRLRTRQQTNTVNSSAFFIDNSSYDAGWVAFATTNPPPTTPMGSVSLWISGERLKDHVIVNNWQNGWKLPDQTTATEPIAVVLLYWPQYLQYLGFITLFLAGAVLVAPHQHVRRLHQHVHKRLRKNI